MRSAIHFEDISKRFGQTVALQNVSLTVPAGGVFGLAGMNGAGKTTLLRILLGLTNADAGTVTLFNNLPGKRISYAPELPGQYDWMSGREYLELGAGIAGVSSEKRSQRVTSLLERVQLGTGKDRIATYTTGMKQQLGLAFAMVGAPDLLVLDEVTSALDPADEHDLVEIIDSFRNETTILFASHVLTDVEQIADSIAILDHGSVIAAGTMDGLRERLGLQSRLDRIEPSLEDVVETLIGDEL